MGPTGALHPQESDADAASGRRAPAATAPKEPRNASAPDITIPVVSAAEAIPYAQADDSSDKAILVAADDDMAAEGPAPTPAPVMKDTAVLEKFSRKRILRIDARIERILHESNSAIASLCIARPTSMSRA